ncbi:MAG: hypothetical protein IJQ21_02945 [Lachnospiraceae bacterium]|nr:hypothetical protein [Lachnospiraceae bacterium]
MPKNVVAIVDVDKEVFRAVLEKKKSSIRKLGADREIQCSEKTIRRELKERQGLRHQYIMAIAKALNVDSRLLTGGLINEIGEVFGNRAERLQYCLDHIDEFPFFREEQERLRREKIDDTLKRVLSLFEVSYKQFEEKSFEDQYVFQHDLLSAMIPIMNKHFDRDGYGRTDRESFYKILTELEQYKEDYYLEMYADQVLRKRFLESLPAGYSRKEIQKMSSEDLIALDRSLQMRDTEEDPFESKYM